jgi:2-oxo-3-hexenedioate decarboxylase
VISSNLLCARADCWIIIAVDPVEIYQRLATARRLARQVDPPSRIYSDFSLADGYAVARLIDEEMLAGGAMRVGKKLGFTNQDVWSHVGLDTPFWSPMYDTTVTDTLSVPLAGLVQPRIETEIILGFSADLPARASATEIGAAIGWAAAGFEIVQCHYPRWEMTPADAVADAGLHAILVIGERVDIDPAGSAALADVDVELLRGETVVSRGRGSNALGGPVQAIAWLLRIPGVDDLVAGDIVTTGTLTSAHPLTPGECWRFTATGGPGLRGPTLHVEPGEN